MRIFLFLSFIAMSLSGCGLFSKKPEVKEIVITQTQYVHPHIPQVLFKPCIPNKPIPVESYLTLSQQQKEEYLTDYVVRNLAVIKDCNTKLTSIEKLLLEQKKLKEDRVK